MMRMVLPVLWVCACKILYSVMRNRDSNLDLGCVRAIFY